MQEVSTIGLDIAKLVFHAHCADTSKRQLFSRRLTLANVLPFFAPHPRCLVAVEACGSSDHWEREITRLGNEVKLSPPPYVKPFVTRQKNDAADAEAICEAAARPSMRLIARKSEEQQAAGLVLRTRDLLVRQRTQTINAI
jgi:transposase